MIDLTFEEFIKKYFPDFKPYPYQLEMLKLMQDNKKPFVIIRARQHMRLFEAKIIEEWRKYNEG